jgi:hypothetical protein
MRLLLNLLAIFVIGVALSIVALEWFAGCGDTYVDARGRHHMNGCLFLKVGR